MTMTLLKYEINQNNNKALLAVADIYFSCNKNSLALDWYKQAKQIDYDGHRNIEKILKGGKVDWSPKYHSLWPILGIKIVHTYDFGCKHGTETLCTTSFQSEVVLLMLIAKFKHVSRFNFTKLLYKNIFFSIVASLAIIWLSPHLIGRT